MEIVNLTKKQVELICEPEIRGSRYRGITGTKLLVNTKEGNLVVSENRNGLHPDEHEQLKTILANLPHQSRNKREAAALAMLDMGICPVRLGTSGKWLKIPVAEEWQTAVVSKEDVIQWFNENAHTNIGARGGRNSLQGDKYLVILDFDYQAKSLFPQFQEAMGDTYNQLTISQTRQGYHVWFFLNFPLPNKTLAGERYIKDNKRKVKKYIETRGEGGQVVAPHSLHPTGFVYQWLQGGLDSIPLLTEKDMKKIRSFCQEIDKGAGSHIQLPSEPPPKLPRKQTISTSLYLDNDDIREQVRSRFDLLRYATSHMAYDEIGKERRRTKVGGNGGFFVYHEPYHWYCFADSVGGDCFDLVGYIKHGPRWFDNKRELFREILKIAAKFVNMSIPEKHGLLTGEQDPLESLVNMSSPKTRDYWNVIIKQGYSLRLNAITQRVEANGNVMDKFTEAEIMNYFYDSGFKGEKRIERAWLALAAKNSYHPVVEYLDSLQWDGKTDHIGNFVKKYIKDEFDFAYPVIKRWLMGSCSRARYGTQNITMVWAGKTRLGKSTLARWLCPLPEYFIEANMDPRDRRGTQLRCVENFVWEWPEADQIFRNYKLVSAMKDILTRETIKVDRKYESDSRHLNLANHIATFNDDGSGIFTDTTGNKRYAVIAILLIDHSYKKHEDVNALWAHADGLLSAGEQYYFTEEEQNKADEINELYMVQSFTEQLFNEFFEIIEEPGQCDFVSLQEIFNVLRDNGLAQYNQDKTNTELKRIVKKHGFNPRNRLRLRFCIRNYKPYGFRGIVAKSRATQERLRCYELTMQDYFMSTCTGELIDPKDPFWDKETGDWKKLVVPKKPVQSSEEK